MYGRGVKSIAEQIDGTVEDAQKIIDDFYKSFPKVETWISETQENAKKNGYVEDLWGRRRRLPDLQLPKYRVEFLDKNKASTDFNPLLGAKGLVTNSNSAVLNDYLIKANKCFGYKQINALKKQAEADGVHIHDNSGFISQAERQCVNARIQGGAATMSKKAMIKVHYDKELNDLGFRLMIPVHDELIGECPEENAERVAERLCEVMRNAAKPEVQVPFKCDPTIERSWYDTDYNDNLIKDYKKLLDKMSPEEAFNSICESYSESTTEILRELIQTA